MTNRFKLNQVSSKRITQALDNRIRDIPYQLSWKYSTFAKENKKRILEYKNLHEGKKCFIIANGPSLKKMNLELLSDEFTFGLNRIYLNFTESSFRPSYYVAVNELVLQQFHKDIEKLEMPKFLNYNVHPFFSTHNQTINFIKSKLVFNDYFSTDLTKPFVFGGTVTFVTLQLAFYMGFTEVILIGLDHNYVEKGTPNQSETRNEIKDESHFHPDYFPKGSQWQLPDLVRSEFDYSLARKAFEENGRSIMDATIGGKCLIFEKGDFENQTTKNKHL